MFKDKAESDNEKRQWLERLSYATPMELEDAFNTAVTRRDLEKIDILLNMGHARFTPDLGHGLKLAAEKGFTDIVEHLLKKGAPVDWMEGLPLILAVQNGHAETAWALVKAGAVDDRNNGQLFHAAAAAGQVEMMEWLHNRGAACDLMTALKIATEKNREKSVSFILSKAKPADLDNRALTALQSAFQLKNDVIARQIMAAGIPDAARHELYAVRTTFYYALFRDDTPLIEKFLERGAVDQEALDKALFDAATDKRPDLTALLIREGAKKGPLFGIKFDHDEKLQTVFNDAAAQEPEAAARAFEKRIADGITLEKLREKQKDGSSGFLLAALGDKWGDVAQFLEKNPGAGVDTADFTTPNRLGRTVLDVLGRRKKLGEFFDEKLWKSRPADLMANLLAAVPQRFRRDFNHVELTAQATRRRIDEKINRQRKQRPGP